MKKRNLLILIFSILVIVYYYFAKASYDDYIKLKNGTQTEGITSRFRIIIELDVLRETGIPG